VPTWHFAVEYVKVITILHYHIVFNYVTSRPTALCNESDIAAWIVPYILLLFPDNIIYCMQELTHICRTYHLATWHDVYYPSCCCVGVFAEISGSYIGAYEDDRM
jgi:hypothetical protein